MQGLFLLWLVISVAIFVLTGSSGMGQHRRQKELARRFTAAPPQSEEVDNSADYRPYTNPSPNAYPGWAPQVVADDVDEGISVEMPQEQPVQASPTPTINLKELDAQAQELLKAVVWSEILQPPLALRRSRR